MTRLSLALAAVLAVGCQENASDTTPKSSTSGTTAVKSDSQKASSVTPAAKVSYREVVKGNNLYIAGSKQAADRANSATPSGFTASDLTDEFGRKVYFDSQNEAALKAEYGKLHKK